MKEEWDEGSEETRESLAKGHGITFPSGEEAIKWLTDGGREMDIREEIAEYLYNRDRAGQAGGNWKPPIFSDAQEVVRESFFNQADQILSVIKEADYIQLDPDQSLPSRDYAYDIPISIRHYNEVCDRYEQVMLQDNWKKVKKVGEE